MPPTHPRVVVAQIGSRMHYAVPALFARAGMLERFYTDVYAGAGSALNPLARGLALLPRSLHPPELRRFLGRAEDAIPRHLVHAFNLFGLRHTWAVSRARTTVQRTNVFLDGSATFARLAAAQGLGRANVVYAFNTAALELFQRARREGVHTIHEQTIAPMRVRYDILADEAQRWPRWEEPFPPLSAWVAVIDREAAEWSHADSIFCGSNFVAQALTSLGVPSHKVRVIPYGIDLARLSRSASSSKSQDLRNRALRILFVGAVSLRKGVQYLHDALSALDPHHFECRVVGPVAIREPHRGRLARRLHFLGLVPRNQIAAQYQWADVFVLPTLLEGSATVVYEALACGLPVVTTPNAGSVVRDAIDGYVVPVRDSNAIADRLTRLRDNPDLCAFMSANARRRAAEHSWEKYAERLIAGASAVLGG